jgi:hypothetical protein
MNNLAAAVVLILAVGGGFAGYQWYINNTGEPEHFKLVYEQQVNELSVKTVMLGRTSKRAGWQKAAGQLESDLVGSCAQCRILEKSRLKSLNDQQIALFNQEKVDFNYISMDTSGRHQADIRMYYPSMGERYTGKACEFGAEKISASMDTGKVRCIKTSG